MKKLPKILTIIFFSIFILQMVGLIFLLTIPQEGQAAADEPVKVKFNPQVSIGQFQRVECPAGLSEEEKKKCEELKYTVSGKTIGEYIQAIYNYAIGIVGILAAVILMFGGVRWLTAGGSPDKITDAKAWIGASLSGLVLALASYMILNTINPDLISFKEIAPATIKAKSECCYPEKGMESVESEECIKNKGTICKLTEACVKKPQEQNFSCFNKCPNGILTNYDEKEFNKELSWPNNTGLNKAVLSCAKACGETINKDSAKALINKYKGKATFPDPNDDYQACCEKCPPSS